MKRLEDMSLGYRIMLTIAILVVILILVACVGYWTGQWEADAAAVDPPSKYEDQILALDRQAIDNAYLRKVEQLFEVWLRDPTEQPARAVRGVQSARRAYIGARIEIEKREQQPRP
jgi:hypothetical protein